VETKSGQTIAGDFFAGLESFASLMASSRRPREVGAMVVYGGTELQRRSAATVIPWTRLDRCEWWDAGA
jgi:hypothetical protein